ncbi:MAG: substrate-binding domain-containing protein [Leptospirillum sp.]
MKAKRLDNPFLPILLTPLFSSRIGRMSAMMLMVCGLLLSPRSPLETGSVEARAATSPVEAPWNHTPPVGFPFTVFGVDNVPDLHGDPVRSQLTLFVAGNQFMVFPELLRAFRKEHPEIRHIFYETLPPGILAKQISKQGLTIGNLHLTLRPDVYESGLKRMTQEEKAGLITGKPVAFAQNDLAIMVSKGNPLNIQNLQDLAKPGIRLSLPNPRWEGIGKQIRASLLKAGGSRLVKKIFETKKKDGTTFLTHIHHRQTAYRILRGQSDAGITWISEVLFQEKIGHPVTLVRIPGRLNTKATYVAGMVKGAPHSVNARLWLKFLSSSRARAIYRQYGFSAPSPKS